MGAHTLELFRAFDLLRQPGNRRGQLEESDMASTRKGKAFRRDLQNKGQLCPEENVDR